MEKEVFKIEGMSCVHCEKAVNKALKKPGICRSVASLQGNSAEVEFDPSKISRQEIISLIEEAGYKVL